MSTQLTAQIKRIMDEFATQLETIIGGNVKILWKPNDVKFTLAYLQTVVSNVCGVQWEDILKKNRHRQVVVARQLYCYFARKELGITLQAISDTIQQDHTTVMASTRKIEDMIDVGDTHTMNYYSMIQDIIHAKGKAETKEAAMGVDSRPAKASQCGYSH